MYYFTLFTAISNFEVEKSLWRPYLSPLYKISPLPPRLKVKFTDLANSLDLAAL